MKKAISIAILAIFLVSILPLSLAEEDDNTDETDTATSMGNGGRLKERLKEIEEERTERLKDLQENPDWAKYNETLGYKARVLDKIKIEKARENYIKAKERFILKKMDLEQAKLKFQEKQELRKQCKETGDCNITDEELIEHAKNFLGNSADAIIEHLNKVKEKIQENEDLTDEEANAMIAKIDAKIAEIEAAKEQVQNATTRQEIVDAAQTINAAWKNIKMQTEVYANGLINARIGGIIVKSDHLSEKLSKILARMEANGKNVSDVQPLIDEFDAKIKLAKEKYEAAVQAYKEYWLAEDKPEAKDKLEEAKDLLKEAKEALKDANEKLREIVKAIKEKNGEEEIEDENKEEDEEEQEEGNQTETPDNETS